MNLKHKLALAVIFFLMACQPTSLPEVTIIDNNQVITFQTQERVPMALLDQAGITLNAADRLLINGFLIAPSQTIDENPITLQIRRAKTVSLITPDGQEHQFQTSAFTVGEALTEAGINVLATDKIDPPTNSRISNSPFTIIHSSSIELTITVDGKSIKSKTSARTVGEALAEAGIPLLASDYSLPSENEALPSNGQIKVVRVRESVLLAQKSIPFESQLVAAPDVPLDQTQILSPGENGLSVQRIRIRYEDGNEVSRLMEDETTVRPPKTRTLGYGTKVEVTTATVNGAQIEYWRAVQMYATSYSPCRLGTSTCGSTTASGKQLEKGMVALPTNLYLTMQGQRLYIPGYGFATVEDACGGCGGQPMIDLGYTDNDYQAWHSWVTVYFLTPVPQNIVYLFE
jgi:uncharacterized protein YabE (DUF348 family)